MQKSVSLKPDWLAAIIMFSVKNGNVSSKISLSRIFQKIGRSKTGQWFLEIYFSTFSKIGTKLPLLHSKRNVPVLKHSLKILHNCLQMICYKFLSYDTDVILTIGLIWI